MKNFRVNLVIRILLMAATMFVPALLLTDPLNVPFLAVIVILLIYQVVSLVRFVDRTNRELKSFLESIHYSDFSHKFNFGSLGKSFRELSNEFNLVVENFKRLRSEREESLRYLETIVQHVGVGLMAVDTAGNVELINRSAKRVFGLQSIRNVQTLNGLSPNFGNYLLQLPDNTKKVYRLSVNGETIQLLLYATSFRMREQMFKLVAIQNILPELEEKEIEAYQKLIRVLTHEIMNSVTPISSLASTVGSMLEPVKEGAVDAHRETLDDILSAITVIQKRSEGLIHFVDKYRSLTRTPKPAIQIVRISELFQRLHTLMETALNGKSIVFTLEIESNDLELATDPDLLEQVLINILNNAVQSLINSKEGKVELRAYLDKLGKACIQISDNGPGIPEDLLEKIFIPFFTTRQEGSGIGLSISQQIVRALGGTISVSSTPDIKTSFTIRL